MGSPERAEEIASEHNPLLQGIVKRAFAKCGNCQRRIECGAKLIDIDRAVSTILSNERTDTTSIVSRGAGSVLYNQCRSCDRLERCIGYWYPGEHGLSRRMLLSTFRSIESEDEAARLIEGVLRDQGLTAAMLLKRVARMWLECDEGDGYITAVEVMKKRGKA